MTRIVGLDLETTGFVASKGHRIVEVCAQVWDVESRTMLRELAVLVNPLREIPAEASRVHGIFIEDLQQAPTWERVAPAVNAMLGVTSLFVAHNISFDAPFLGEELLRVGQTPPDIQTFCTMKDSRWATANGKVPKLAELCWALDIEFDPGKAHRATYDVTAMMNCLWKGMDAGYFKLPTKP